MRTYRHGAADTDKARTLRTDEVVADRSTDFTDVLSDFESCSTGGGANLRRSLTVGNA